jgi:hypothetical protein
MSTRQATALTGPNKKRRRGHLFDSVKNSSKASDKAVFLQETTPDLDADTDAAPDADFDTADVDCDAAVADSRTLVVLDTVTDTNMTLLERVTEMLEANKADNKKILELVLKNQKQQSKVNQRSTELHEAFASKCVSQLGNDKPVKKKRGRRKGQEVCNAFAKATERLADKKVFVLRLQSNWKCGDAQVHTHTHTCTWPTYVHPPPPPTTTPTTTAHTHTHTPINQHTHTSTIQVKVIRAKLTRKVIEHYNAQAAFKGCHNILHYLLPSLCNKHHL